MGKLTARQVETLKTPGRHADGGNLYLNISKAGAKSWVFFYRFEQKQKEMGLGSLTHTSLADARRKALGALKQLKEGLDPLAQRRLSERTVEASKSFGVYADDYIATHRSKWKSSKHANQWQATLGPNYCSAIRGLPLTKVDTEAVLKVLKPLWQTVPETAARIRGRIENIIDAAKAEGLYQGDNPARWKGHLKAVLPPRQKLTRGHHAALPYDELPGFIVALRAKAHDSIAAMALEYCILTVTRTNETLGALVSEIDFKKEIWTVPAKRMKAGKEHRIPLSGRAVEIIKAAGAENAVLTEHLFPGDKAGRGLSNMAMLQLLKRMGRADITVHGFRSSFSDWVSEQTSFSHETREHALAHRISDQADAAYRRGDQFEKRRKLMEAWQAFCESKPMANVLPMKR